MPLGQSRHDLPDAVEGAHRLPLFSPVRFTRALTAERLAIPAGTRGIVVDLHEDGGYGVEISSPVEDVVIVTSADIMPA